MMSLILGLILEKDKWIVEENGKIIKKAKKNKTK
jgi:hypothetical protein